MAVTFSEPFSIFIMLSSSGHPEIIEISLSSVTEFDVRMVESSHADGEGYTLQITFLQDPGSKAPIMWNGVPRQARAISIEFGSRWLADDLKTALELHRRRPGVPDPGNDLQPMDAAHIPKEPQQHFRTLSSRVMSLATSSQGDANATAEQTPLQQDPGNAEESIELGSPKQPPVSDSSNKTMCGKNRPVSPSEQSFSPQTSSLSLKDGSKPGLKTDHPVLSTTSKATRQQVHFSGQTTTRHDLSAGEQIQHGPAVSNTRPRADLQNKGTSSRRSEAGIQQSKAAIGDATGTSEIPDGITADQSLDSGTAKNRQSLSPAALNRPAGNLLAPKKITGKTRANNTKLDSQTDVFEMEISDAENDQVSKPNKSRSKQEKISGRPKTKKPPKKKNARFDKTSDPGLANSRPRRNAANQAIKRMKNLSGSDEVDAEAGDTFIGEELQIRPTSLQDRTEGAHVDQENSAISAKLPEDLISAEQVAGSEDPESVTAETAHHLPHIDSSSRDGTWLLQQQATAALSAGNDRFENGTVIAAALDGQAFGKDGQLWYDRAVLNTEAPITIDTHIFAHEEASGNTSKNSLANGNRDTNAKPLAGQFDPLDTRQKQDDQSIRSGLILQLHDNNGTSVPRSTVDQSRGQPKLNNVMRERSISPLMTKDRQLQAKATRQLTSSKGEASSQLLRDKQGLSKVGVRKSIPEAASNQVQLKSARRIDDPYSQKLGQMSVRQTSPGHRYEGNRMVRQNAEQEGPAQVRLPPHNVSLYPKSQERKRKAHDEDVFDSPAAKKSKKGYAEGGQSANKKTPITVRSKQSMISFSKSGPRNQGNGKNSSRNRNVSHAQTLYSMFEDRDVALNLVGGVEDDIAPASESSDNIEGLHGVNSPKAPGQSQTNQCSQNTRVTKEGSPMPLAHSLNSNHRNEKSQLILDRDADNSGSEEQNSPEGGDQNPITRRKSHLGMQTQDALDLQTDAIPLDFSKNPKHKPSSPTQSSEASGLAAHHILPTGQIYNPETQEAVIPSSPQDPFVIDSFGPQNSFIHLLRQNNKTAKKRANPDADPQLPNKRQCCEADNADDPDKTLVEPDEPSVHWDRRQIAQNLSISPSSVEAVEMMTEGEAVDAAGQEWYQKLDPHHQSFYKLLSESFQVRSL